MGKKDRYVVEGEGYSMRCVHEAVKLREEYLARGYDLDELRDILRVLEAITAIELYYGVKMPYSITEETA